MNNAAYIFLPFVYDDEKDFPILRDCLDKSDDWAMICDENKYMLKYVAEKFDCSDREKCQCFHYRLNDASRENFGIKGSPQEWYITEPHDFHGKNESFGFRIENIQLFLFTTAVGIVTFRLCFEKDDPYWISIAEYYLKKVSKERISPKSESDQAGQDPVAQSTLLEIAGQLVRELNRKSALKFFYHANAGTERANILTWLEVAPKEDYRRELFYLRTCCGDGTMIYVEDEKRDESEIYESAQGMTWGITSEAAVCLTCPSLGNGEFLQSVFLSNFHEQYLFMYVLLLHQKYVLYMFLTKIGIGIYNDLKTLEAYRNQLYEFETDFVFSYVTEVPQYQNLYEKMMDAFALRQMFEDVHEPLMSLSEARRLDTDRRQEKRDQKLNLAISVLTLLGAFSACIDSYDFMDSFLGDYLQLGSVCVRTGQMICIAAIFAAAVFVLKNLISGQKED